MLFLVGAKVSFSPLDDPVGISEYVGGAAGHVPVLACDEDWRGQSVQESQDQLQNVPLLLAHAR